MKETKFHRIIGWDRGVFRETTNNQDIESFEIRDIVWMRLDPTETYWVINIAGAGLPLLFDNNAMARIVHYLYLRG